MEEILPAVYRRVSQFTGPHHPVNSYVLKNGNDVCVIDPAADFTLFDLQSTEKSELRVFITHLQNENAAGAHAFGDATIWIPPGDLYLTRGRGEYEKLCGKWLPPWEWETRGNYPGHLAGARNERPLEIPLPQATELNAQTPLRGIQWIQTPGHGKHAVTYLAEVSGKRIAFCGDLIFGDGKVWNWYDLEWDYGLESGVRTLVASAKRLLALRPDILLPSHGPVVTNATESLSRLVERLERVLVHTPGGRTTDINFAEIDASVTGFRQITPQLYQWRTGNCAVLVSQSGHALFVDAGLCHWVPLDERAAHFRNVVTELKEKLGIHRIEIVIPTHFHGDHTENIPDLIAMDGTEVVCLDSICGPLEHPEAYNLAAQLPWYGTRAERIKIDRKLSEGQTLTWREYELELFHLGGQTFYHLGISVRLDGQCVLFVGDGIHNQSELDSAIVCYNDAEPASRGWSYAVDQMYKRNADLLVCGHGSAIQHPMAFLDDMRRAWKARLAEYAELNPRSSNGLFFSPFYIE